MNVPASRKIAIVAGEPSGDLLASLLLKGLLSALPAEFSYAGIGGPRMIDEGFTSHWPMETLSVNGYVEVLPKLPAILRLRKEFINRMLDERPLAMIGVDAPDFTLGIELALRRAGIPTVHFVSPSIWAWRGNRVHKIGRAAEHVLCLFPFEPEIYHRHGIGATYVGHPLADVIPLQPDVSAARRSLALGSDGSGGGTSPSPVVAVLPGSRRSEVQRLGNLFMQAMSLLARREPGLRVIMPAATPAIRAMLAPLAAAFPALDLRIIDGKSHLAMEAADVVLLASGTATLEAALFKKPMVISYKVPWLTGQIMKRQGYLPYVGLPNILSGRFVVPELLQDAATPQALADAVHQQLRDDANRAFLQAHFTDMHLALKRDTARVAAEVVRGVLERHGVH